MNGQDDDRPRRRFLAFVKIAALVLAVVVAAFMPLSCGPECKDGEIRENCAYSSWAYCSGGRWHERGYCEHDPGDAGRYSSNEAGLADVPSDATMLDTAALDGVAGPMDSSTTAQ
jgi:hypothetical protein